MKADRFVSVVIPARNEATTIGDAVRSALEQEYAPGLEVVVADGESEDGTAAVVASLAASDPRVRLVRNPERTTPAGLNAAIRAARGAIIVRCDGHSVLPPGYVQRAVDLLDETGADNVGGVQEAVGVRPFQRAVAIAMTTPLGVGDARFHYGGPPGPVDTVYLGVFRREAIERAGWYDESLIRNQDYELNYRIRRNGGMVYFDPRLRVAYSPRSTPATLWRQYFQYGAWKRRVLRLHPGSVQWRQLAAPGLLIGLGASAALAFSPWRHLALIVPAAYTLGLVVTAVVEGLRRRDPAAALVPAAIATMHVAWGTGFLAGRR